MKPHPRIRTTIKWSGAAVTLLLVGVWMWSGARLVHWETASTTILRIEQGRLSPGPLPLSGSHSRPGWHEYRLSPFGLNLRPDWSTDRTGLHPVIPLWIPPLAMFALTAAAWALDILARRRARTTHCPKCGYDRTGLAASAKCPECGAAPAAR
jgi:hypothetical protein